MKIFHTPFDGLLILEPAVYYDDRGHFSEVYNQQTLSGMGIDISFVQDNQSFSKRGVIRGLHFQNAPKPQTKLVRALEGVILDVVVDLRKDKPTFGQAHTIELSKANRRQLLVPKGFAHGFSVLSDTAEILYKCDAFYTPGSEGGIRYDDPELQIDWQVEEPHRIVSAKDAALPLLKMASFNFSI